MARARSEILRNTKVSVRGQNTEEKKKGVEAWAGLIEKCQFGPAKTATVELEIRANTATVELEIQPI